MSSKGPIPISTDESTAPPAYSESPSQVVGGSAPTSQYYRNLLSSHLSSLTAQVSSAHTQRLLKSNDQDEKILSILTSEIQTYLSLFAASGLQKGTLIIVPSRGLEGQVAEPLSHVLDEARAFDRVVRVSDKQADEDGDLWFWKNAAMARRLAGYLRPAQPVKEVKKGELPPRKQEVKVVEQSVAPTKGFWGRKKSVASTPTSPLVEERRYLKDDSDVKKMTQEPEDRIDMDVKAEEVLFRTENDLGIYETQRGYGIVLRLKIVLGRIQAT